MKLSARAACTHRPKCRASVYTLRSTTALNRPTTTNRTSWPSRSPERRSSSVTESLVMGWPSSSVIRRSVAYRSAVAVAEGGQVVVRGAGGLRGVRDRPQIARSGQPTLEGVERVGVGDHVTGQRVHP